MTKAAATSDKQSRRPQQLKLPWMKLPPPTNEAAASDEWIKLLLSLTNKAGSSDDWSCILWWMKLLLSPTDEDASSDDQILTGTIDDATRGSNNTTAYNEGYCHLSPSKEADSSKVQRWYLQQTPLMHPPNNKVTATDKHFHLKWCYSRYVQATTYNKKGKMKF